MTYSVWSRRVTNMADSQMTGNMGSDTLKEMWGGAYRDYAGTEACLISKHIFKNFHNTSFYFKMSTVAKM